MRATNAADCLQHFRCKILVLSAFSVALQFYLDPSGCGLPSGQSQSLYPELPKGPKLRNVPYTIIRISIWFKFKALFKDGLVEALGGVLNIARRARLPSKTKKGCALTRLLSRGLPLQDDSGPRPKRRLFCSLLLGSLHR